MQKLETSDRKQAPAQIEQGAISTSTKLAETEAYIGWTLKQAHWERTPLFEACRTNNTLTVEKLLVNDVQATAKDLLGETAVSLLLYHSVDAVEQFIDCCVTNKRKFLLTGASRHQDSNVPNLSSVNTQSTQSNSAGSDNSGSASTSSSGRRPML